MYDPASKSDSMLAQPRLPFRSTAALYSVIYAVAVSADHVSTLLAVGRGAIETNLIFATTAGTLNEARALLVFVAAWPVMILMLWMADRRARTRKEPAWLRQFLGRTPTMAALLPVVLIFGKFTITASNLMIVYQGTSFYTLLRPLLFSVGVANHGAQTILAGILLLLPALFFAYGFTRWWYGNRPIQIG